ncbi:two-partner secretion domain-containing protein [Paraburkholderia phytofirmans]|uniref:Filamentous haemagglutinin family outer membrane protein n=1 Tax=Paraburkholderia phytofirmans (strain DSM 17436 / LMG 22146 / PsJN) TaxID=398527 RepID=B2SWP9_PARPJ|nr:filamentous hemagglutinin N-terminal domain-containing protein [Paraburkholderia phytofirmans]ACD14843.1 filamentous haemagglutinin family outer membrane protein [Paraburkholderia phytofirmans PsJN]
MQKTPPRIIDSKSRTVWFAARASAFAALCAFGMQPLVASAQAKLTITPDAGAATRPTIGTSSNGTQVVNIVAPNAAGVSSNRFSDYNVGTGGVIINNATQAAQTQIGGTVQANSVLGKQGAKLVLMQVTSGAQSQLLGTTEIAGNSANLVLANPAGITCSGCGFLNAPRVTLATGTPTLKSDGSLDTIDVKQGTLAVDGGGLNGSTSAVDLIARAITINGKVQGKSIDAIAGANRVNYASKSALAQAGTGSAPQVAIDVQSLGSMYGDGAVRLLGTEAGVGVRDNGTLTSLTGNLSVGANGDVTIAVPASIKAAGNAAINGANVTNDGSIAASGSMDVHATQALANRGTITADSMSLIANTLSNAGKVAANGIRMGGDRSLINTGTIEAAQQAELAGDSMTLAADSSVNSANVTLRGGTITNQSNAVNASRFLNINADHIDNAGTLSSGGGAYVNAMSTFANGANGTLTAQDNVQIGGGNVTNDDLIASARSLDANGALSLTNRGTLTAGDAMNLSTRGSLLNSGKMSAASLSMTADQSLTNSGTIDATTQATLASNNLMLSGGSVKGGTVTLNGGTVTNQNATVNAGQLLDIRADNVENTGTLSSNGDARVNAMNTFMNGANGTLTAQNNVQIGGTTLNNSNGSIEAVKGTLSVQASTIANLNGKLSSGNAMSINTRGDLDNTGGTITAGRDGQIDVGGKLTNDNGSITSQAAVRGTAGSMSNVGGTISAPISAEIRVVGDNDRNNGGFIPPVNPTPEPERTPAPKPEPTPTTFVPPPGFVRMDPHSPDLNKYSGFYDQDGYFYARIFMPS